MQEVLRDGIDLEKLAKLLKDKATAELEARNLRARLTNIVDKVGELATLGAKEL